MFNDSLADTATEPACLSRNGECRPHRHPCRRYPRPRRRCLPYPRCRPCRPSRRCQSARRARRPAGQPRVSPPRATGRAAARRLAPEHAARHGWLGAAPGRPVQPVQPPARAGQSPGQSGMTAPPPRASRADRRGSRSCPRSCPRHPPRRSREPGVPRPRPAPRARGRPALPPASRALRWRLGLSGGQHLKLPGHHPKLSRRRHSGRHLKLRDRTGPERGADWKVTAPPRYRRL